MGCPEKCWNTGKEAEAARTKHYSRRNQVDHSSEKQGDERGTQNTVGLEGLAKKNTN
ncbi:MAG: hypothetical protein QW261_15755 [Candidatus Jordarchaeaceae archaeon]